MFKLTSESWFSFSFDEDSLSDAGLGHELSWYDPNGLSIFSDTGISLTGDPVTVSMSGDSGLSKLSPGFPKFG